VQASTVVKHWSIEKTGPEPTRLGAAATAAEAASTCLRLGVARPVPGGVRMRMKGCWSAEVTRVEMDASRTASAALRWSEPIGRLVGESTLSASKPSSSDDWCESPSTQAERPESWSLSVWLTSARKGSDRSADVSDDDQRQTPEDPRVPGGVEENGGVPTHRRSRDQRRRAGSWARGPCRSRRRAS
jgi:hypothetical protein